MFRDFDYENMPVVDIVDEILNDSIASGVSDIHFDPTPDILNIRVRIDGELREYAKVPASVKKNLLTRVKIISGMNITETRLPQDGAIKHINGKNDVDMRVSSLPIVDGEKIVVRILDYSKSLEGIETLDFTKSNLEKIMQAIHNPHGIILVSGATGSGKSTTVYSILQKLNDVKRNIITVEDPVEMKIPGINQVQVLSEIGLTFTNTLRSILRQDPDTIMIGEIRDDETARIAVRASITGHLVISTIHTNNSLTTIERLLDMEVERYLLGSALTMVISQRLTKRLCPHCRKKVQATKYQKNIFKKVLNQDVEYIYQPVGCSKCFDGYRGRVCIQEVLLINQEIRDAIVTNMNKHDLKNLVYKEENVQTLFQDGLNKVANGITSFDELLNIIDVSEDIDEDDDELRKLIIGNYDIENTDIEVDDSKNVINEQIVTTSIFEDNKIANQSLSDLINNNSNNESQQKEETIEEEPEIIEKEPSTIEEDEVQQETQNEETNTADETPSTSISVPLFDVQEETSSYELGNVTEIEELDVLPNEPAEPEKTEEVATEEPQYTDIVLDKVELPSFIFEQKKEVETL